MELRDNPEDTVTLYSRIRRALGPTALPEDDRGRMRMVVDNLALHLHPAKVPDSTLSWTYTWGLGGLSALLITVLGATGVFLQMNYTPSPPQAYMDILTLRSDTWFGDLLRNLHHWSANLLVAAVVLHLLRVFLTGSYRPPRETNWIFGVMMLILVLAANFTGYLLPWDQLAYWAVTVGSSILAYVPLIGNWLSRLLLGGSEVGSATLLNFYSLHISFIPMFLLLLMSLHFWRVRKDGGLTLPRRISEIQPRVINRVTTIPHLVRRELVYALVWIAALFMIAMLVPAPLEGIANPEVSPNPAKAPWYFMGIQELLLHFHPFIGAVVIPGLALAGLFMLPFIDYSGKTTGVYFRSLRGRPLALIALGFGLILTPSWVLLDEFILDWTAWLPGWPTMISGGIVPLALAGLGLLVLDEFIKRKTNATFEERILFLAIFLFTALMVLTVIGVYFRGPGMELYWPWQVPGHEM